MLSARWKIDEEMKRKLKRRRCELGWKGVEEGLRRLIRSYR